LTVFMPALASPVGPEGKKKKRKKKKGNDVARLPLRPPRRTAEGNLYAGEWEKKKGP